MRTFLFKLIPPRSTFVKDLTQTEATLMQEHGAYWKGLVEKKVAIAFGLVLDPKTPWGVCIFECEDETTAQNIAENDPTVKANLNTFELFPMHAVTTQETAAIT